MILFPTATGAFLGALILLLAGCVALLALTFAVRLARESGESRRLRFRERWEPVLHARIAGDRDPLPRLARSEREMFLALWLHLLGYVRDEAAERLNDVARELALERYVLRSLDSAQTWIRILAMRAVGALRLEQATGRLLAKAEQHRPHSSLAAVRALLLIRPEAGLAALQALLGHLEWSPQSVIEAFAAGGLQARRMLADMITAARPGKAKQLVRLAELLEDPSLLPALRRRLLSNRDEEETGAILCFDRLKQALAHAQRAHRSLGFLFVDLDRFKNVNDTLGHPAGDRLLQEVAARLTRCVRGDDTVSRLGGDEFAVLLTEIGQPQDAAVVAKKIVDAMARPFNLGGSEVFVGASIGVATYPTDGEDGDTLVKNADAAMFRAKLLGRNNVQFYTAAMNERAAEKLKLENSLRHALERGEFLLHYQPKADLASGRITGFEALLRWKCAERGLIAPKDFVPILEESGLIVPVGEWVVRAACAQLRAWRDAGLVPVPVAVNLSARQFRQQDVCGMVERALLEHGVEASLLELEITETVAMENAEQAAATLNQLHALGVHLSMDDFGTGYSSLSYLKRFPLDSVKIDRSFVTDLPGDADDAAISKAVIGMAHSLSMKVIAEGVENEGQRAFLAGSGCDQMQGYLLARPHPAEECQRFLEPSRDRARAGARTREPAQALAA